MHLSPEALAGYLDQDLTAKEQGEVELHLARCLDCREELAEVRRLQVRRTRRQWGLALVSAAAAAAAVLAIALPRQSPIPTPTDIRTGSAEAPLGVVTPGPVRGAVAESLTFVWRSAGAGASYVLTLQQADGRIIWTSTTAETLAVLPDTVVLGRGPTWFWFVDAMLLDGRSRSTGVKRLSIPP